MVRTTKKDTFMAESVPYKTHEIRPRVARGVLKTMPNKAFCVIVVNTSKFSFGLPKSMEVGQLTEVPSTMIPLQDILLIEPVNAIQNYKRKHNKK